MHCEVPLDASKQLQLRPILRFDGRVTRSTKGERLKKKMSFYLLCSWRNGKYDFKIIVLYHVLCPDLGHFNSHYNMFYQEKQILMSFKFLMYCIRFFHVLNLYLIPSSTFPLTTNIMHTYIYLLIFKMVN